MAMKVPLNHHSRSRKHICGYPVGVSTVLLTTFLCMLLVCFFFLDVEMMFRKAGTMESSQPVLQRSDFAANLLAELNSTTSITTPVVEVMVYHVKHEDPATPAQEESSTLPTDEALVTPGKGVEAAIEEGELVSATVSEPVSEESVSEPVSEAVMETVVADSVEEKQFEAVVSDGVEDRKIEMKGRGRGRGLVGCDITQGRWVFDNVSYPLYRTRNCPFADEGFRCEENGRPDLEWMSYHWQPHDCDLPRFNATDILERLRGQRMVFVGDSLGRNNWESMLCMLAEGVSDKSKIYEVNGEPITKHSGKLVYRFVDYNCTVEYYRDPFLVPQTRPPRGSPANVSCALRVDHVSWSAGMWWNADIIIFNAGHWWTEHKIFHQGCRFQEGDKLRLDYSLETGLIKALHTWAAWLETHLNPKKSEVFWLSFPSVHFRGGTWNRGGHCHNEHRPLTEEEARAEWQTPWMNQLVLDEFMARIKKKLAAVTYLDITTATNYRSDGHGALYNWDTKKYGPKPRNRQDCSHFCLPGVPDAWNELILASLFAKGKGTWAQPLTL